MEDAVVAVAVVLALGAIVLAALLWSAGLLR